MTPFGESYQELIPWIPRHLRFTPTHEWVHLEGDVATVGISKFAVDQLTDLIMIELPAGREHAWPPARASARSRASRR